ncbi:hypothetical protein M0R45_035552 [Rubus argutus]|uniref:Plastocyanin-like domain-containing protein n=1 Tax=Rubus argutus TaxID=59490 RepID=A0AAW1VUL3_RUBAR
MHLHGYSFYVVGQGFGIYDNVTDPKGFNLVDPPEVTTFGVPKNGWLAIRFTANNPGVWFWHCHMDRHLTWGMEAAFVVKNGGTTETSIRQPPAYMPPCMVPLDSGIQNFHESIKRKWSTHNLVDKRTYHYIEGLRPALNCVTQYQK